MKYFKNALASAALLATLAPCAFAQGTQSIPIPASSVGGTTRATVAIVMPTEQQRLQELQAAAAPRGWSSYFVGQQKCINTFPGGRPAAQCFKIQNDGSILLVAGGSLISPLTPGTSGYDPVTVSVVDLPCFNAGTAIAAGPAISAADITFGRVPTDWALSFISINGRQCDTGGN